MGGRFARHLVIPGLVAAALAAAYLDSDSGIRAWLGLRRDVAGGEARLARMRAEIAELEAAIASITTAPFAQDRAIREDLAWARPGETVVLLGPATPAPE